MTKQIRFFTTNADSAGGARDPLRARHETTPSRALLPLLLLLSLSPAAAQTQQIVFDVRLVQATETARNAIADKRAPEGPSTRGAQQTGDFNDTEFIQIHLLDESEDVRLLLQGERRRQQAELLATPRIRTLAGQQAVLHIGGRQAVPTLPVPPDPGPRSTGPVSEAAPPDIQQDLGILLTLKPFPLPDGTLHIRVNAVVRTADFGQAERRRGYFIPALVTRQMTTQFGLKPGQTFAITGLLNPEVLQRIEDMPELKSLPLMRQLLNGRGALADSDLVVLITPRLAPQPAD